MKHGINYYTKYAETKKHHRFKIWTGMFSGPVGLNKIFG